MLKSWQDYHRYFSKRRMAYLHLTRSISIGDKLKNKLSKGHRLSIHLITIFCVLMMQACGGGGSGTLVAEGGISGTGITFGPISGFGSIYVNGVRYDVDHARFFRDGELANAQSDYRIGEIVTITGEINPDGTGQALTVEFMDSLEGNVSQITQDNLSFEVLGQKITINGATLLHGFKQLSELRLNNIVEISAQRNAAGDWLASSVSLKQSDFIEGVSVLSLEGNISALDIQQQTFKVGKQTIDYSKIDPAVQNRLTDAPLGQAIYIRASSQQALQNDQFIANTLTLSLTRSQHQFPVGTEVELTGIIDQFISSADFHVNGQAVTSLSTVSFENGQASDLQLNTLVEVEGIINAVGVLEAEEIAIKQQTGSADDSDEIEGVITQIDRDNGQQTLLVQGRLFLVDHSSIIYEEVDDQERTVLFEALHIGDKVEIYARQLTEGVQLALKIKRKVDD
ncbi:MAG TPA: hypothetical protein ENK78_01535 [Thiothrix sp.]|nr:hypothetical protein [Thiothrix sp.]